MMYHYTLQIKKPLVKALSTVLILLNISLLSPSLTTAQADLISPVPTYLAPKIKGDTIHNSLNAGNSANLGLPVIILGVGSGALSGLFIYKRRKQKNAEEINFVDSQTY